MLPTNSVRPKPDFGNKIRSQPRVNLPITFLTTNFKRAVDQVSVSSFLPPQITNSKWPGLKLKLGDDSFEASGACLPPRDILSVLGKRKTTEQTGHGT
jgi:hypothetical protein